MRHRKFAKLARLVGDDVLARGHLELVWEIAYENGDDLLGEAADVEYLARWKGEPGALASALLESGFLDASPEGLRVHDLWDHAPEYVAKRAARETEREERGETISSLRSRAGKKGAESRWQTDGKRNPLATDSMANGLPHAPAPAHTQELLSAGAPPAAGPGEQKRAKVKAEKPTDPRHRPTQDLLEHVFREARGCAYGFQGRDAKAVAEILRLSGGDTAEIERRWRIGLNELGFRRSDSIHDLATKWNAYAGTAPRATSVRKVTAGSGAAEDWKLTEEERSWANTSRKA